MQTGSPKYLVYGLIDPRSGELRYVGQTNHLLCQRLAQHEHAARRMKDRRHNTQWIRSLQAEGLRPEIFVLEEELTKKQANEVETFYIGYFRMVGCRLNNHTDGGEGAVGYKHDANARARIFAGKKGKSQSERWRLARRAVLPDRELELVEMYRNGASLEVVGEAAGLSGAWAFKLLKRHNVPRRLATAPSLARKMSRRKLQEADELRAVELYQSGLSALDVAAVLGVSGRSMLVTLHRRGVEVRSATAQRWLTAKRKVA